MIERSLLTTNPLVVWDNLDRTPLPSGLTLRRPEYVLPLQCAIETPLTRTVAGAYKVTLRQACWTMSAVELPGHLNAIIQRALKDKLTCSTWRS